MCVRLTDFTHNIREYLLEENINQIVAFGWKTLHSRISVEMKIYDVHFPGRHNQARQYNKRTTRHEKISYNTKILFECKASVYQHNEREKKMRTLLAVISRKKKH